MTNQRHRADGTLRKSRPPFFRIHTTQPQHKPQILRLRATKNTKTNNYTQKQRKPHREQKNRQISEKHSIHNKRQYKNITQMEK